ncbi:MAG: MBL fold metallo-hydrolase [Gammaproteobacteria bacterium]
MRYATLASGSGGNATLIEHAGRALLVDCGPSARTVAARIAELDFDPARVDAILVTHEHDDHVGSAAALARRHDIPVHVTAGTARAAAARLAGVARLVPLTPGQTFTLGPFAILPVIVPHDAREPCQFVIAAGGRRFGILTDLGQPTAHVEHHYRALDGLMLEFNHEPELLARSPYPRSLQQRIGGDYGHLSNGQASTLLARLEPQSLVSFTAAHLSEKTNTPAHVAACLATCLPAAVPRHIARQDAVSPWFALDA